PISAIIFGGRRAATTPLVYQSFSWQHGTYVGSAVSSETTAAATGAVGVLRHDPMAMKPFCGYHMADYWAHWLEMGEKLGDKAPKIFNVNWFKQDENGNFMWPGFGDNMRVLDWIIKRCEGTIDADTTPIGYLPKKGDINLEGIEDVVTCEVEDKLLAVDRDLWKKEVEEMKEFYKQFGDKLPDGLKQELADLEARLG
ncbi:MAG: phosphoenolpyruvate carboxykinase domain-containing protein, partial [Ruminiclostridium sp.]